MKFRNFQLIVDNNMPVMYDMEKVCRIGQSFIKNYGKDWYEVDKRFVEDRFLWLYCEYDDPTLYNESVFNGENDEKELNPRSKLQVELRKQLFVCYDTNTGILYMNKIDKRGFVKHYISDTLQKGVVIKNIYTTLEEFQDAVKSIKALKFVQQRSIMNEMPDSIFQQQANIYGLDGAEKITMQVDYGNTPIAEAKNAIQNFKRSKDKGQFESIILVGVNDDDVEENFDFSSMMKVIDISVVKNENGRYDQDMVRAEFLNRIR